MQEFSDLINYCHNQYISIPQCVTCSMDGCKKGGGCDCYNCLKYIHSYSNHTDHYSCKKITYNYILKHGHRYASEISKAVCDIKPYLDTDKTIYAISIGCGPSTEFYGIVDALYDCHVSYIGFDQNPIWADIQAFNQGKFEQTNHKIQYSFEDFFEFMRPSTRWADILVLNYFFSDLIKFHKEITTDFIKQLAELIKEGKFKWVVMNDIPLFYAEGTGYICMEKLIREVSSTPEFEIKVFRRHFSEPNQYQISYGNKISNHLNIPIEESVVQSYSPFSVCGSIQAIIMVKSKNL